MIKFSITHLIVLAAIAVIMAGPAYCQADNMIKTVDGTVVSVDHQNSQIVIKASENLTFSVSSAAQMINKDGFDVQLSDIKPGNYVTVDYYDDSDGRHVITNLEIGYAS